MNAKRTFKFKPERDYEFCNLTKEELMRCYEQGKTVTGQVIDYDIENQFMTVQLGIGIEGILPFNEVCIEPLKYRHDTIPVQVEKLALKKAIRLKITKYSDSLILLSRKANLLETIEKIRTNYYNCIFDAVIVETTYFGVFCEIADGNVALCKVEDMSKTIINAKTWYTCGTHVKVKIIEIDNVSARISCSIKDAANNNYYSVKRGTRINVKLASPILDKNGKTTGFFVEITPGISGIADIKPENKKKYRTGDIANAYIRRVFPETKKIKLFLQ